jgi:hypothetical protein
VNQDLCLLCRGPINPIAGGVLLEYCGVCRYQVDDLLKPLKAGVRSFWHAMLRDILRRLAAVEQRHPTPARPKKSTLRSWIQSPKPKVGDADSRKR